MFLTTNQKGESSATRIKGINFQKRGMKNQGEGNVSSGHDILEEVQGRSKELLYGSLISKKGERSTNL